jgi:hypothetical protein
MMPRGLRNNNPLNIRHSADRFRGEIAGTDKSFKTFSSLAYGYRAAFVILGTYLSQGCNTIEKIISRWAPPAENDTESYISDNVGKIVPLRRMKQYCCVGVNRTATSE